MNRISNSLPLASGVSLILAGCGLTDRMEKDKQRRLDAEVDAVTLSVPPGTYDAGFVLVVDKSETVRLRLVSATGRSKTLEVKYEVKGASKGLEINGVGTKLTGTPCSVFESASRASR